MSTPEGRVKEIVRKVLKEYGVWFFSPVSNGMGVHGIPDFVGIFRGKSLMVETKALGRKPTPRQEMQIAAIRAAGGKVFVIDGDCCLLVSWLDENK